MAAGSRKNWCSNHVICCPVDEGITIVCIYNIKAHYKQKHPEVADVPDIDTNDRKRVKVPQLEDGFLINIM